MGAEKASANHLTPEQQQQDRGEREREKRGEDGLHTARGNNKLHPSAAAALDLLNNLFYSTFM